MSRHESTFSQSLLSATPENYGSTAESSVVTAAPNSTNTTSPQIFREQQTHFKAVEDLIGAIFKYVDVNDKQSLLNFRAVSKKFAAASAQERDAMLQKIKNNAAISILIVVSTIRTDQTEIVIAQPGCTPIVINNSASLQNLTTALRSTPRETVAQQVSSPTVSENNNGGFEALMAFKLFCEEIASAMPSDRTELPSSRWTTYRNYALAGGASVAVAFYAFCFVVTIGAALSNNSALSNSLENIREKIFPLPKNTPGELAVFLILAGPIFLMLCCCFMIKYGATRAVDARNGVVRPRVLERKLTSFTPAQARWCALFAKSFPVCIAISDEKIQQTTSQTNGSSSLRSE